ncbi:MAG: hypothetical protein D8M59_15975 [Planctomycetes bacterium]|nr:hypothetical protein [Planctomycetota bacterium]NOG52763.1 hypothetical protein [Planctomycetota bacterium]
MKTTSTEIIRATTLMVLLMASTCVSISLARRSNAQQMPAPAKQIDQERTYDTAADAVNDGLKFTYVDIYLDSGSWPLAAYQFELAAEVGDFEIVGIEGGEHTAFTTPPYYDPAALQNDHVILGAFSTDDDLPAGKTRVARVHVMINGTQPHYTIKMQTAATTDGSRISVNTNIVEGA